MDYIRTAAGSEVSDQSYRATSSKPNWILSPLPFAQIRPRYDPPQNSGIKSLASCALTTISLKFDRYSLSSFTDLPPHLIRRIIARVRADRNYAEEHDKVNTHPDEATVWAIQALHLPSETPDHTLGLPSTHLLSHMQGHPITTLPVYEIEPDLLSLSAPTNFRFLTTMTLGVSDGQIDDRMAQSLRWCTHLTALWMRGLSITDYGISLMASALELPGNKGLCRLRAWSLLRCKGITDKSMKTFAKFPGLIMLDVRETSCTDVAMDVFNRQSAILFPHPGFQACTPGLIDLFATDKTPDEILAYLCATLMKVTDYTALHIVPTTHMISAQYTPFPHIEPIPPRIAWSKQTSVYRADGVGVVYGQGVSSIANPVNELRRAVKNLPIAWQIDEDRRNGIERKRVSSDWDRDGRVKRVRDPWKEEMKPKTKCFDAEKLKKKKGIKTVEVKGDPRLMMVRMIDEGWEQLKWYSAVPATNISATQPPSQGSQMRRGVSNALMSGIMSAVPPKVSDPFRPVHTSSPASSPRAVTPNHKARPPKPSLNPFRVSSATPNGVKPLKASFKMPTFTEGESFDKGSADKKMRFDGAGSADKRRSGMKMFTSAKK